MLHLHSIKSWTMLQVYFAIGLIAEK